MVNPIATTTCQRATAWPWNKTMQCATTNWQGKSKKNLDLKSQKYILLKRSEYQKLDSVLVQEVMLLAKEVQKDSVQANTLIRYGEAVGKRKVVSFILGSQ
jgi:hypothetical protein